MPLHPVDLLPDISTAASAPPKAPPQGQKQNKQNFRFCFHSLPDDLNDLTDIHIVSRILCIEDSVLRAACVQVQEGKGRAAAEKIKILFVRDVSAVK